MRTAAVRLRLTEGQRQVVAAFLIGLATGVAAAVFRLLAQFLSHASRGSSAWWLRPLLPAAGALLGSLLARRFAADAAGHGVPVVIKAVALGGGRLRSGAVAAKTLAAAATIGSGGSAGIEGPIALLGAGVGSGLGQLLGIRSSPGLCSW
ncbi:MAG: chloride channel protein [Deinococcus sp.]|nr:chloride channel protein [Deinococcus sp.]